MTRLIHHSRSAHRSTHQISVPDGTSDPAHFALRIPIPVRARAYRDLYQHPGCVKNSIKWGPHLMLVLTAPESGPSWTGFDAGFHRPHFEGQNGVLKMAHPIRHTRWHTGSWSQIPRSDDTSDNTDPAFQMTHQVSRQIAHHIYHAGSSTPDNTQIQHIGSHHITHLIHV